MSNSQINLLDVNPLERITGDIAISQSNYESIMNGLVQWDQSKNDTVTIRLATRTDPYFVDYKIPTKYFYDKTYGTVNTEVLLEPQCFAYTRRVHLAAARGDDVTLRINSIDNGDTTWKLYEDVTVYDEYETSPFIDDGQVIENMYIISRPANFMYAYASAGLYFRTYDNNTHEFAIYKTLVPIAEGTPMSASENSNGCLTDGNSHEIAMRVCFAGTSMYPNQSLNSLFYYNTAPFNAVYVHRFGATINPSYEYQNSLSGYEQYCLAYTANVKYKKGEMVYCGGDFFVSLVDYPSMAPVVIAEDTEITCEFHPEMWARIMPIPFNTARIAGSGTFHSTASTDLNGYIFRNIGDNRSGEHTSMSVMGTISVVGEETPQTTGVNIIPTSNYANWPEFSISKWAEGSEYHANASLTSFDKQDYSAVMVFKHYGDEEHFKYKNIINYDGPDVDQGLVILLPVTITGDDNKTHDPADGSMIEFMFNIWPNHKYDGQLVNDLIINKSQIYVYSVPDYSEYLLHGFNSSTVMPLAKFSMARLVNFYVFSENVGVPDKPVCYKARFIFSKKEGRWKTYDYYQLPDHVFMSPNGFVDPSDPAAYGVQTAGFPLYQNPFSNYDLTPIHITEEYRNQLQHPGE